MRLAHGGTVLGRVLLARMRRTQFRFPLDLLLIRHKLF